MQRGYVLPRWLTVKAPIGTFWDVIYRQDFGTQKVPNGTLSSNSVVVIHHMVTLLSTTNARRQLLECRPMLQSLTQYTFVHSTVQVKLKQKWQNVTSAALQQLIKINNTKNSLTVVYSLSVWWVRKVTNNFHKKSV